VIHIQHQRMAVVSAPDENGNIEGDPSKCSFTSHSS
jgi:hypothetical protein